jgi:hypothetical protein
MTIIRTGLMLVMGAAVFGGVMSWSGETRPTTFSDLFSQAEAVIGRPLTPVSYAGVARRTTRRVAYTGAAAATAVSAQPPPPQTTVVVAPTPAPCTIIVDTTGKVIKPCP